MKFLIIFALVFATVWAKDLHSRSIEVPVLKNEGRIANGLKASPGQFYYLAGINSIKGIKFYWCGGSFIGHSWILTAAHCIAGALMSRVYLGANQRLVAEQKYDVSRNNIILHPYYNSDTIRNDIGFLRIPETPETDTIRVVHIPRNNDDQYLSDLVVIAGWGHTSQYSKQLSSNLQYAIMKVSRASVCVGSYEFFYNIQEHVCVATPSLESACDGDDGSPLVLYGQMDIQIGVFSFGAAKGCEQGLPLVFTRVSAYLPWIKNVTKIV